MLLPAVLMEPLRRQCEEALRLHRMDLAAEFGPPW
ncbi:hypothetical protein HNQ52_000365 [Chiayiivirga flava]|uniref:Uncharacterized protein n=1 Tax=Chiayiivirga flava TaxID=659595 RepID=A0A7W8D2W4_9GAMM|nr:hypothetical protein [Chiayiivirga flava]